MMIMVATTGLSTTATTAQWDEGDLFLLVVWHVRTDRDGRDVYAWSVQTTDDDVIARSTDDDVIRTGCQGGDARSALSALVSFLSADAERYQRVMGPITDPHDDQYLFGEAVAEWAYMNDDALAMASCEIDDQDGE